jgi:hypothetical protein
VTAEAKLLAERSPIMNVQHHIDSDIVGTTVSSTAAANIDRRNS